MNFNSCESHKCFIHLVFLWVNAFHHFAVCLYTRSPLSYIYCFLHHHVQNGAKKMKCKMINDFNFCFNSFLSFSIQISRKLSISTSIDVAKMLEQPKSCSTYEIPRKRSIKVMETRNDGRSNF